jgi:hypothetical protein
MSTDSRFPGPGDYAGSFDARMHDAVEGAQSTFDGSIVVTLLERSLVQQVLPDGFHLSARTDGGGEHPVIHLVGHQRDHNGLHNGSPYKLLDNDYSEMILLVPFVLRGSGTKLHTFVVRMYLDDVGAIQIGNWIYGYAKEPARIPWRRRSSLYFEASFSKAQYNQLVCGTPRSLQARKSPAGPT